MLERRGRERERESILCIGNEASREEEEEEEEWATRLMSMMICNGEKKVNKCSFKKTMV